MQCGAASGVWHDLYDRIKAVHPPGIHFFRRWPCRPLWACFLSARAEFGPYRPQAMTVEIVPSNQAPPIEKPSVEGTPLEFNVIRVGAIIRFRKGKRQRGAASAQIGRTIAATSTSPFEPAAQRQPGGRNGRRRRPNRLRRSPDLPNRCFLQPRRRSSPSRTPRRRRIIRTPVKCSRCRSRSRADGSAAASTPPPAIPPCSRMITPRPSVHASVRARAWNPVSATLTREWRFCCGFPSSATAPWRPHRSCSLRVYRRMWPRCCKRAISALQRCQPFIELPADKYKEWKTLDLFVTPLTFSGG